MTWRLRNHGVEIARGSYAQMLDAAEALRVLERTYHVDGTAFAPRWCERGWSIAPVAARCVRRAA